ncbi:MAG: NADH-quinone oxidoreductase subunit J [Nitrospirae bacterium]|nr:NADH-quinone oxidoreductase subunit J [Nitrospirota bacterium]
MASQAIFIYLAIAIIALSVTVITRKNPVHSIVFMLLLFFHIAGLYLTLNAEFLAAIQVIVYAGAILVLFLFVVLMLNLKEEVIERRYIGLWPLGLLLAVALLGTVLTTLKSISTGTKGIFSPELLKSETPTKVLAEVLYTEYLFPFEIASVVLLVAIVGAIVLAKKRLKS